MKYQVKVIKKNGHIRLTKVEASNIDEAIENAFKLCNKYETPFVTKQLE